MSYPLPQSDIEPMLMEREVHTSILDPNTGDNIILYSSTKIKVEELIGYFYEYNCNRLNGIRFWPGIMDYSLVFPIISVSSSAAESTAFCLLEETSYLSPENSFSEIASRPLAMRCFAEYKSNVLIDGQNQASIVAIDSRFMEWTDMLLLLQANIPGFIETNPSTFTGYSIKIEQGYLSSELAAKFYSQYGIGENNTDYIGYTVILSIYDRTGVPLINPAAPYVAGEYSGRYLEANKPCPPFCS